MSSRSSVPSHFHITSLYGSLFCVTPKRVAMLHLYVQYIASAGRVSIRRSFRMVRRRNAALVSKFSLEVFHVSVSFAKWTKFTSRSVFVLLLSVDIHLSRPLLLVSYILKPQNIFTVANSCLFNLCKLAVIRLHKGTKT